MSRFAATLVVTALVAAVGTVVGRGDAARADEPQLRVLFIGNSFTRMHDLPHEVQRIAEADLGACGAPVPGPHGPRCRALSVARETRSGATLRRHWIRHGARWRIESGAYTHVVLQDHSMRAIERPAELTTYARLFDKVIERAGARTVLYATWARRRHRGESGRELGSTDAMQTRIDDVYGELADELHADVAPVGLAWIEAGRVAPDIRLYGSDGIHPSPEGTYLAACVLYGALTHRTPEGTAWSPWPMPDAIARRLRAIAADSLRAQGIELAPVERR